MSFDPLTKCCAAVMKQSFNYARRNKTCVKFGVSN